LLFTDIFPLRVSSRIITFLSQLQQQRRAAEIARAAAAAAAAAEEEAAAEEQRRAQAELQRQQRLLLQQQQLEVELAASLRREFAVLAGVHWRVVTSRRAWRCWSR
jgi:hypothetical protein